MRDIHVCEVSLMLAAYLKEIRMKVCFGVSFEVSEEFIFCGSELIAGGATCGYVISV